MGPIAWVKWSEASPGTALLCSPAIAAILAAGILTGHAGAATVASSGALSVGFGVTQQFTRRRNMPVVLAMVGMALSAAVGSLAGGDELAILVASSVWAAACGWFTVFGQGAWWISLQWAIALFIATAFPADLRGAAGRAALICAGGVLQITVVLSVRYLLGASTPPRVASWRSYVRLACRLIGKSGPAVLYGCQTGVSALLAIVASSLAQLPNGYWAPMTALLVIKPDLRQTLSRGLERALGTLAGAGVATLAAATLRPGVWLSVLLSLLFAAAAYTVQRASYATFTASLTAYIVFVLALNGLPERANAVHRIIATFVGAAVALAIGVIASMISAKINNSPSAA